MAFKYRLIVILFSQLITYGQENKEQDSIPIVSYVDKIIIKANIDTQTDSYIVNYTNDDSELRIKTNNSLRLFLSLDYEFIGASIGFAPSFFSDNNDDNQKGESKFSDFKFRFFLGNWVQSLEYNKVEGFYLENTADFIPDWNEGTDPYIQFPNLKKVSYAMSTSYVFNPKFSYRNITYQTEWQKKSAGSFVPTLHYNYNRLSISIDGTSSIEDFYNLRLALGYYYTFVINENWFIAPFISPSLGVRFSETKTIEGEIETTNKDTYFLQTFDGGLQLGYSSKRFIFGLNFNTNVFWYEEDKITAVTEDRFYGLAYFGYRFDSPKFVKNTFDWFYEKLGIPR